VPSRCEPAACAVDSKPAHARRVHPYSVFPHHDCPACCMEGATLLPQLCAVPTPCWGAHHSNSRVITDNSHSSIRQQCMAHTSIAHRTCVPGRLLAPPSCGALTAAWSPTQHPAATPSHQSAGSPSTPPHAPTRHRTTARCNTINTPALCTEVAYLNGHAVCIATATAAR
jgi:hypothetical protein